MPGAGPAVLSVAACRDQGQGQLSNDLRISIAVMKTSQLKLQWWHTPFIAAGEAEAGKSPWVSEQSHLQVKFLDSQGNTEKFVLSNAEKKRQDN